MLAVVAVAAGSAVVGMPQAHALPKQDYMYWEKVDQDGNPLGGSTFELNLVGDSLEWAKDVNAHHAPEILMNAPTRFVVTDNESAPEIENLDNPREAYWNPFHRFQLTDLDPRPGHFLVADPLLYFSYLYNAEEGHSRKPTGGWGTRSQFELKERETPSGYTSCDGVQNRVEFAVRRVPYDDFDTEALGDGKFRHTLKKGSFVDVAEGTGQGWLEVTDKNFRNAMAEYNKFSGTPIEEAADFSVNDFYKNMAHFSATEWVDDQEKAKPGYVNVLTGERYDYYAFNGIYAVGALSNCQVEGLPSVTTTATAEPSTVVATTTQSPVTSTLPDTTVTNPPVTVTNPGTTVTRPDTTITQPPVVSTIPGTTTTKPGTTVTEPAKTLVTTLPGTTVREPGTIVREPATTVHEPSETVATTLREPDVTVTPVPVTVEKEKPVAVETVETVTPDVVPSKEPSETPVTEESASETPETTTTTPEASSNSNDARILASTGANIVDFVAIAGLLIGLGVFAIRRRK